MEYHITHYDLEQGALEIQYIEEFFGEFPRKKTLLKSCDAFQDARTSSRGGALRPIPGRSRARSRSRTISTETVPKLVDLVHRPAKRD